MIKQFDAAIIGGGAAGLMCAVSAKLKNKNLRIAIIEKNDRVGKKLLSTGNGRCNLTNSNICSEKYLGSFKNQSGSVFKRIDTEKLVKWFENLGLLSAPDAEGRYYPLCKQAAAVLDVLRFQCGELHVEIFCKAIIRSIKKSGEAFLIKTENGEFLSRKLVIATGSKAAPKLGGNGSGADYLQNFGHKVIPFSPVLCPVEVNSPVLKSLKGLRANAKVSLIRNGEALKTELGEVQFAENALSGICVFNLSLYSKKGDIIKIDLLPDISKNELFNILIKNKTCFNHQTADNIFTGILQKRIAQAVLKLGGIKDFSRDCSALSKNELFNAADSAKKMLFEVTGNSGFDRAQAALGGVLGKEIDENTMQSRKSKNLYVCGEAVDLCGECGGYNLHFAFASGIIAGENL